MDVCMLVANDARRDPRVQKEARSLVRAGRTVSVIGLSPNPDDQEWEEVDGYRVRRVRPEGWTRAGVKKRLSQLSPGAYQFLTKQYRRVRGIPERAPSRAGPGQVVLPPEEREVRNRHQSMIASIRTHDVQSGVMAQAAILTAPRVIHAHDLNTLLAGAWAARATGAALVFDSHEIWWEQHAPGVAPEEWIDFYRELQERLIPSVDAVITVCPSIAEWLGDFHAIEVPNVVRNSIELVGGIADPTPRDGPLEVLFHGGFSMNRGLEELIEAATLFENARLALRGFGPLQEKLQEMIEARGLQEVVRFEEPVPMKDVVSAASRSDLGVIPYKPVCLNNQFSTPNKLFEYLNAGVAVAASDLPEIRRVVEAEACGLLFDPTKPASIAAVVNELSRDRPRLHQMRKNARRGAEARHHWGVDEQILLAVYDEILKRGPLSRAFRIATGR